MSNKELKEDRPLCYNHNRLIAPPCMAWLMERGKEDEITDRVNVHRLSQDEKDQMSIGHMAHRHLMYENYCQDIQISYKAKP